MSERTPYPRQRAAVCGLHDRQTGAFCALHHPLSVFGPHAGPHWGIGRDGHWYEWRASDPRVIGVRRDAVR